jgi:hypothetical protein
MGKISFTMDLWTDLDKKPYMAITSHWMEKQSLQVSQTLQHRINFRSDLIGFLHLPGSHTGIRLAETFLFAINNLGIANKVSFFPFLS